MASQQTVQQLIDYYTNLIIIQYASDSQPKAQATIAATMTALLANGVALDVLNGYNIIGDDIAVGTQLDVIGKYVGIDRNFAALVLENYFGTCTYLEESGSDLPTTPPVYGANTYTTFSDYDYNGTLQYSDIIVTKEQLTDAAFYTLIQFAIIRNNMNFSFGAIDSLLFNIFGTEIWAEYPSAMNMIFFINAEISSILQAIIYKNLLPIPMAVGARIVSGITGLMFGMISYSDYVSSIESPFEYGFTTYSNYDTVAGQVLTYSQISQLN